MWSYDSRDKMLIRSSLKGSYFIWTWPNILIFRFSWKTRNFGLKDIRNRLYFFFFFRLLVFGKIINFYASSYESRVSLTNWKYPFWGFAFEDRGTGWVSKDYWTICLVVTWSWHLIFFLFLDKPFLFSPRLCWRSGRVIIINIVLARPDVYIVAIVQESMLSFIL